MNFGKLPTAPAVPSIPSIAATPVAPPPTHASTDVGRGPVQGNVGIGLPQHLDPNKPAVGVDATIHNPTGIGGDIHVKQDVPIPTHMPDVNLPSMGSNAPDPLAKSGGGFGLPKVPSFGMPSMPDISMPDLSLPSMPDLPDISLPSLPDMPSIGMPDLPSMPSFGMPDLPSFGMPDMPDFGMPDISLPGMPGFRFPDLPKFELPDIDLSEWDLSMPDLIPDWDGDSEDEQQEPHKRAKHQDNLTVEICLENQNGQPVPKVRYVVHGANGFEDSGTLDGDGKDKIKIPRGDYRVEYPDHENLHLTLLALDLQWAIQHDDCEPVASLLEQTDDEAMLQSIYGARCTGFFGGSLHDDLADLFRKHDRKEEFQALWSHFTDRHRQYFAFDQDDVDTLEGVD